MSNIEKMSQRELRSRLEALQKQTFTIFEQAAAHAQSQPEHANATYLQAEKQARPLIEEGDALRREWVRRARRRARLAWYGAAIAAAVLFMILVTR